MVNKMRYENSFKALRLILFPFNITLMDFAIIRAATPDNNDPVKKKLNFFLD